MNDAVSEAYWAGAARNEFVVQRCDSCGTVRHYPRILCSTCYSFDWSPAPAAPTGTVYSWTVAHHVFDPTVTTEVPYTLVTVDMNVGVRVIGRFDSDVAPTAGQAVVLEFRNALEFRDADGPTPVFTPAPA